MSGITDFMAVSNLLPQATSHGTGNTGIIILTVQRRKLRHRENCPSPSGKTDLNL